MFANRGRIIHGVAGIFLDFAGPSCENKNTIIEFEVDSSVVDEEIQRMNELIDSEVVAETEEEKVEQAKLRREYIDSVKNNLRAALGNPEDYKKGGDKS